MALRGEPAAAAAELRIVGVDAARCSFPLVDPLLFGRATYSVRDYVALRIRTDGGLCGHALALGRGTPLLEAARPGAERIVGADPVAAIAAVRELRRGNVPGYPALVRGHSLLDVGLWDLRSKAAGVPLHELLGRARRDRVPVLATGGYLLDVRGEDAIVEELIGFREQGYEDLKLMLGGRDVAWTHAFLSRCLEEIGPGARLALDFHFSFADVEEAARVCEPLDELGLAFLEDPLPPLHWRGLRELSERLRTPLAAGEDVPDSACYDDVLEGASVLRVDATTCGGLEDAVAGIELASAAGKPVLPHGSPWLSAQLAAVYDAVERVEIVPPTYDNGDRIGELFSGSAFELDGTAVRLGEAPGMDVQLDWERVAERAQRAWSV
jgi:L-alanine-DL-glutamate epimerase-like enolase superfamily enzyme